MKKRMRWIWVLACQFMAGKGMSQLAHLPVVNHYNNSGAYSRNFQDAFSFTANPASLSNRNEILAGVNLERKWMLPELDQLEFAFCIPAGSAGVGIRFQRSGDADYLEQGVELAYGKQAGPLDLGVRFGFLKIRIAGYTGPSFGYAGFGVRGHISENIMAGLEIEMPVIGQAGKTNPEKGPQTYRMGFGYEWENDLLLALQIEKVSGLPVQVSSTIAYRYDEHFFFCFGFNSGNGTPVFQSGWQKNQLGIQLYTVYDPALGFCPGILLLWKGKNKKT